MSRILTGISGRRLTMTDDSILPAFFAVYHAGQIETGNDDNYMTGQYHSVTEYYEYAES